VATDRYEPEFPSDVATEWAYRELQRVSQIMEVIQNGHLDLSSTAPEKPQQGDIRYADGVNWDPLSIGYAGIYFYNGSEWELLMSTGNIATVMDVFEATASATTTLSLTLSRRLVITNDSATQSLDHRFTTSATWATVKAGETVDADFATTIIYLRPGGGVVPYRVWSYR